MRKLQRLINWFPTDTAHVLGEKDLLAVALEGGFVGSVPVGAFMGGHKDLRLQYGVLCSSPPLPPLPPIGYRRHPQTEKRRRLGSTPNISDGRCNRKSGVPLLTSPSG